MIHEHTWRDLLFATMDDTCGDYNPSVCGASMILHLPHQLIGHNAEVWCSEAKAIAEQDICLALDALRFLLSTRGGDDQLLHTAGMHEQGGTWVLLGLFKNGILGEPRKS